MNILGIRLIVPLLCGLLLLAVASINAKEKAKPSPTPSKKDTNSQVLPSRISVATSLGTDPVQRTANPKASPTPKTVKSSTERRFDVVPGTDASRQTKPSPTPTPKAK